MKKPSDFIVAMFHGYLDNEPNLAEKLKYFQKSEYGFACLKAKYVPDYGWFLTSADLAKAFAVSVKTLERWRRDGGGPPYIKVANQIRYPVVVLDKWVRENLITQG